MGQHAARAALAGAAPGDGDGGIDRLARPAIEPGPITTDYAVRITRAWQQSVTSIIEVGRLLIKAKGQLPSGAFTAMVEADLPFSARIAQVLMQVARNRVLADPQHVALLPAAWGTLGELSRLPEPLLAQALDAGKITPRMERAQVSGLRPPDEVSTSTAAPSRAERSAMHKGARHRQPGNELKNACIALSGIALAMADLPEALAPAEASEHVGELRATVRKISVIARRLAERAVRP